MTEIKKLIIFYFSGTGNAKQIAGRFAECAQERAIDAQLYNISTTDSFEMLDSEATIIIISPIQGFNFPKITFDFIKRLPKGNNQIVLMNTRAGMRIKNYVTLGLTGIAFFVSGILLKRKGYRIIGQIPFDMPSNWFFLHPALSQKTVDFIFEKNHTRVEKHAEKLFSGKRDFLSHKDLIQDILISPVALAYYLIGRFVLAKSFYASANCTNCKLCIKQCPAHAIKNINDRPFWTFHCQSCMKCMTVCPEKSIESAHGLIVVVSIVSSVVFSTLSGLILFDIVNFTIFQDLVSIVLFILFLWIFYRLQHRLLRNNYFERIIIHLSLTHYKFWGKRNPKSNEKK